MVRKAKNRPDTQQAYDEWRDRRSALKTKIVQAKEQAFVDLIRTVEEDPWGKPYKIVLNKLRPHTIPLCEKLDPEKATEILDHLFPEGDEPDPMRAPVEWNAEHEVTPEEIREG